MTFNLDLDLDLGLTIKNYWHFASILFLWSWLFDQSTKYFMVYHCEYRTWYYNSNNNFPRSVCLKMDHIVRQRTIAWDDSGGWHSDQYKTQDRRRVVLELPHRSLRSARRLAVKSWRLLAHHAQVNIRALLRTQSVTEKEARIAHF